MRWRTILWVLLALPLTLPILLLVGYLIYVKLFVDPLPFDMYRAIEQGNVEEVRRCLAEGADPNFKYLPDKHGYSPLHMACDRGQHTIARVLVESGAEVDRTDNMGKTPLIYLSSSGKEDSAGLAFFEYILKLSQSPSHQDILGFSALHSAAMHRRPECVKLLIGAEIDVNQQDISGCTPLHHLPIFSSTSTTTVDPGGNVGYSRDYQEDEISVLRILLDAGADPHLSDHAGRSPIDRVMQAGRTDLLEELEKRGYLRDDVEKGGHEEMGEESEESKRFGGRS